MTDRDSIQDVESATMDVPVSSARAAASRSRVA
jgi:hypothetical protein